MQYMAGLERAQGIRWCLNYIHSMKYAEVINASIAANSAVIDYRLLFSAVRNAIVFCNIWDLFEIFLVTCCLVYAVHVAKLLASNILLEAIKMLPSICLA